MLSPNFPDEALYAALDAETVSEFPFVFPKETEKKEKKRHHKSVVEGEESSKKVKKSKSSHSKKAEEASTASHQPKTTDTLKAQEPPNVESANIHSATTPSRGIQFKKP